MATRYMKNCSASLSTGKYKSKPQRDIPPYTLVRMALLTRKKSKKICKMLPLCTQPPTNKNCFSRGKAVKNWQFAEKGN